MNVAVIGANGFIGNRLVEMMHLEGGQDVTPIVRRPASLALPGRFSLNWRIGDALNVSSLRAALRGCDAIVHVALGDPRQIERMPSILCEAAASANIRRVVYLSSASVHGQNPEIGTDEMSPLRRKHSIEYNSAKVRAEEAFFNGVKVYGLEGYALRPGVVYGPRSRWIAELATDLYTEEAWLSSNGQGVFNGIYVDNLVDAIRCSLRAVDGAGEAYIVGDAETITWEEFYHVSADYLGVPRDTIRRLAVLPDFRMSLRERAERATQQRWVQSMLPVFPRDLKRATKAVLATFGPSGQPEAWSDPVRSSHPRITEEMALLQGCMWKLPHAKAERHISYVPRVSFSEGMRRSFTWWKFANGGGV